MSPLQLHPVIKQLYDGVGSELAFPPNLFPSVAPPVPWADASGAGFFLPAGECEQFFPHADRHTQMNHSNYGLSQW